MPLTIRKIDLMVGPPARLLCVVRGLFSSPLLVINPQHWFRQDRTAIARILARKNIEVVIANSRGPETLASMAVELAPTSFLPLESACGAEIIFLAVSFSAHKEIAKQFNDSNSKIVVNVTNAFHVAPPRHPGLRNRRLSAIVST